MSGHNTVGSLVSRDVLAFSPETPIDHAVALMVARNVSGAPVLSETGKLVGILTVKDCFRASVHAQYHQEWSGTVGDFMAAPVQTLDAGTDWITAARRFLDSPHRRFPVVEGERLIGMLTRMDLLRALEGSSRE